MSPYLVIIVYGFHCKCLNMLQNPFSMTLHWLLGLGHLILESLYCYHEPCFFLSHVAKSFLNDAALAARFRASDIGEFVLLS